MHLAFQWREVFESKTNKTEETSNTEGVLSYIKTHGMFACVFGRAEHKLSPAISTWFIAKNVRCWRLLAFTHAAVSQNKGRGVRQCGSTCVTWRLFMQQSVGMRSYKTSTVPDPEKSKLFIILYLHKPEVICSKIGEKIREVASLYSVAKNP